MGGGGEGGPSPEASWESLALCAYTHTPTIPHSCKILCTKLTGGGSDAEPDSLQETNTDNSAAQCACIMTTVTTDM